MKWQTPFQNIYPNAQLSADHHHVDHGRNPHSLPLAALAKSKELRTIMYVVGCDVGGGDRKNVAFSPIEKKP